MSSIVTNVGALNAQRNLNVTGLKMGKVLEKLSSGYRINRAADDAAGLGISEKMRSQIRGNAQALRNAQDGISMIQTAEGAMDEIHSILQRSRELAVQAANGTMDVAARQSIATELVALQAEIDRIATATQFNGQFLLNGNLMTTQSGGLLAGTPITNGAITKVDVSGAAPGTTFTLASAAGSGTVTMSNGAGESQTLSLGALAAGDTAVLNFSSFGISIHLAASGAVTVADQETAFNTKTIVTAAGNSAAKFQVGANAGDTMEVSFEDVRATEASGLGLSIWTINSVDSHALADARIVEIDDAIGRLNTRRSNLGAAQNRLEHTIASLGVAVENLTASESRIRDADIAQLSSQMVSNQILQQAGTAVLAQANQSSQAVLSLLR